MSANMTSTRKPITIEKWRRNTLSVWVIGFVTDASPGRTGLIGRKERQSIAAHPRSRKACLPLGHSAVDADHLAVDVTGGFGAEESDQGRHFRGRPRTAGRDDL